MKTRVHFPQWVVVPIYLVFLAFARKPLPMAVDEWRGRAAPKPSAEAGRGATAEFRNSEIKEATTFPTTPERFVAMASGGGASLLARAGADDAQAFTSNATVVVISSIPGDVESEKTYQNQLSQLMEVLSAKTGRPRNLFILVDEPKTASPPSELGAQVMAATKDNFLALSQKIAGRPDPIVIFVWGHGSLQGSEPVFHVRGPRLTADDFRKFADQSGNVKSRWVLFFRGSGSFARALKTEGREILSSEKETMFTSDPVGMALFLKALRSEPALSFEKLGGKVKQATVAWYEERHLAQTEEPTLWIGNKEQEFVVESRAMDRPIIPVPAAIPNMESSPEMSGIWKEIVRAEPRQFPEADAVILRRKVDYTLDEKPSISEESDEFIQILTEEGKRFGDFDVSYDPPGEDLTFLDCEVLKTDGTLQRLNPDEIHDAAQSSLKDYPTGSRKIFSLPHVEPGAILRVHLQREWKHFPLPYPFLEIPLAAEIPTMDLQVNVRVSNKLALHFGFRDFPDGNPTVSQTGYSTMYSWRFKKFAAEKEEVLAPPEHTPTLLLSTFPDWKAFTDWYERLIREANQITPEISAKAAELTVKAGTEKEKVLAIYNFVTGLRYIAVPLGVNSHRPHAAANVLQNHYGDCKDKANLFNTLLKSLGITADLVLVPRFSQAFDALPGFAFNHAISRVKIGAETVWVDTTDDICRFGLLPPGDPGRKVLVIDGKSQSLTQLPAPAPDRHSITFKTKMRATPDASSFCSSTLDLTSAGYADYDLRSMARRVGGYKANLPLLSQGFRPVAGVFELISQRHSLVANLNETFSWSAEGNWSGLVSVLPDQSGHVLRGPFWLPGEWDVAVHPRTLPLYLNEGYPLVLEQEIEISLPAGTEKMALPAPQGNQDHPLKWRVEWTQVGQPRLRSGQPVVLAKLRAELASGDLSQQDTVLFQKQLRALYNALGNGMVYTVAGAPE